jgi:hypothetical protein
MQEVDDELAANNRYTLDEYVYHLIFEKHLAEDATQIAAKAMRKQPYQKGQNLRNALQKF